MSKRSLIERMLDKWPAKIICLIISIFLYIFHQTSIIDKRNIVVPLKIVENGLVMHVGKVPSTVSVVVRGNDSDVKSVVPSDFEATVNLDEITEKGDYLIPVKISLSEKLMEFDPFEVKLKNHQVEVSVDLKDIKYVELVPSVVGEVAHGYTISSIEMNPSFIEISGAKSILDKISHIDTTKINVSNAKNTFSTDCEFLQVSKNFTIEDINPAKATVIITPLEYEKQFENNSVQILNLDDNFEIVSNLPKINVTLKGTMPDLEPYEPGKSFVQLDCSLIKSEGIYSIPVKINYPKKFQLLSKSFDTINLKIKIKRIDELDNDDENQVNEEEQIFEPADENLKNENKDKEHKDIMLSKVEGAVNNMIQKENNISVDITDTQ